MKHLLILLFGIGLGCTYLALGMSRENPVGTVEGIVVMKENGHPLAKANVYLDPENYNDDLPERSAETDANGHFRIKNVAIGKYSMRASTAAHSLEEKKVEVLEGKHQELNLSLTPHAPNLDVQIARHVFMPQDTPGVHVDGFVPQSSVTLTVTRMDENRIAQAGGLQATFQPFNGNAREEGPDRFGKAIQVVQKPLKKDVEGVFYQRMTLPNLPEGIYWVEATAGPVHNGSYLNITHMALVTKYAGKKLLAYAVDIKSGRPIPGATVFKGGPKGLQKVGVTDAQGLADGAMDPTDKSVVLAKLGDSLAVCERPSENMAEHEGPDTIFLYTDRSIYRPGDEIQFKGIARKRQGTEFSAPQSEPVTATLKDARGNDLATAHLTMGAHGTFHGVFTTSKEAAPGSFSIEAECKSGAGSVDVPVAAYRKPDYTVTVLGDKPYYKLGDTIRAKISCQYYYGGPVVGAKVQAMVMRSEDWQSQFDEAGDDDEAGVSTPGDETSFRGGTYDFSATVVTDANGQAVVEFPTHGDDDPDYVSTDYIYTLTASVADVGEKYFNGSGDFKVVRGDARLSVDTDRYVAAPGETLQAQIKVVDQINQLQPIANQPVHITVGYLDWNGTKSEFQQLSTQDVTTDSSGLAHAPVTAGDYGNLEIRAETKDSGGRKIVATTSVYISGNNVHDETSGPSLIATLDKKQYAVGDTAKLLLQTAKPGGYALVTVQADDILEHMVVPIDQKATITTLPVNLKMSPNAFVSVAYVKDEFFMEANKELTVKRLDRDMQITVTPQQPNAKPGDSVTFNVKTTDSHGKPVSTDASLSLVDEAIFAIRKDTTDIKRGFYPRQYDAVMTSYSFPEIYLDGGDKGTGKMRVRSRFLDTAAWVPNVQTDANGQARVTVKLPDNLTRWRATVVACTENATVGMASGDVTSRKPLMVNLQSPGYLVAGDRQEMALTVTNDTGKETDVALTLNATGIKVDSTIPKSIHVAPGKLETVKLQVEGDSSGTGELTAFGRLPDGSGDAVKMPVRIAPKAVPQIDVQAGDTNSIAQLAFIRREDIDPAASRLRLTLNPSLASSLLQPMGALVNYPYGCVEQTMSRFLPSILVTQAFKQTHLPLPRLADQLPAITSDSFVRLARLQHDDGGWGWWEYDESDPYLTALVLDGLKRAAEAGYPAPKSIRTAKAVKWAKRWFHVAPSFAKQPHDALFLAYALAQYGEGETAKWVLTQVDQKSLTALDLAYVALTQHALGQKADATLRKLDGLQKRVNGQLTWPTGAYEYGQDATAAVLLAYTTIKPTDPVIPEIVRNLPGHREGEMWGSTRDTAAILIGIAKYLGASHEAVAPSKVDVLVNGKVVRTVTLNPQLPDSSVTLDLPATLLPKGVDTLQLRRTGQPDGHLYYTAALTQAIASPHFQAATTQPGLTISRKFFVMEPRKLEDGSMRLLPSQTPVDQAKTGSIIKCEVTLTSKTDRDYLQIECPTPSNCHVTEREDPLEDEQWSLWWSDTAIRDDRITFFARWLYKGSEVITYTFRAESPGTAAVLPATVVNMYDSHQRASTADATFEVTP